MGQMTKLRSKYPTAFKKCIPESLIYGKCVTQTIDLKTGDCKREFEALSKCFKSAVGAK